jgi:hypothetical protein
VIFSSCFFLKALRNASRMPHVLGKEGFGKSLKTVVIEQRSLDRTFSQAEGETCAVSVGRHRVWPARIDTLVGGVAWPKLLQA